MPRSRRPALCAGCGQRPPRKIKFAKYCSPCISRKPKVACTGGCGKEYAPDVMIGRRCRPCISKANHAKRIEKTYGCTAEQYAQLLEFQGGVSAIAGQKPGIKRLAVDHSHTTGEVRGLLTKHENFYLIGFVERFEDPIGVLQRAIDYLREPPARRLWGDDVPVAPPGEEL